MVQYDRSRPAACDQSEEDLVLYYYGELNGDERSAVEGHIQSCEPCRLYLKEMESVLPLTVKQDDPPQPFWDDYSREMRRKLADAQEKRSWWQNVASWFQPWAVPALATAAVAILALTFTLGKGFFRPKEAPPDDQAFIEMLPVADNLEFFKNMEVLDVMDFLESGSSTNGTT